MRGVTVSETLRNEQQVFNFRARLGGCHAQLHGTRDHCARRVAVNVRLPAVAAFGLFAEDGEGRRISILGHYRKTYTT